MSDYNDLVKLVNSKGSLPTCIIKFPSGKWGFVGSIPISLCHKVSTLYGEQYNSNIYKTEQEAKTALSSTKS